MKPILYVFPISHFSEKARWGLDLALFPYELKALYPGEHVQVLKEMVAESSVPVLIGSGIAIQGSSKILDYVDERAFGVSCTDEEREMESRIDTIIGKGLQTMLYSFILAYPEIVGKLFKLTPATKEEIISPPEKYEFIALILKKRYKINPKNIEVVKENMLQLLSELVNIYKDRMFFNQNRFGRVDLTLASLMGSLASPKEAPATSWFESVTMPSDFLLWRDSLGAEFLFSRIREFYKEFRTQSR